MNFVLIMALLFQMNCPAQKLQKKTKGTALFNGLVSLLNMTLIVDPIEPEVLSLE